MSKRLSNSLRASQPRWTAVAMSNPTPHRILSCHETHICARKRFKVPAPQGVLPLEASRNTTAALLGYNCKRTIAASVRRFSPTMILPDQDRLPDELFALRNDAYFVSAGTAWMTQRPLASLRPQFAL
jgi:hypothetical protein